MLEYISHEIADWQFLHLISNTFYSPVTRRDAVYLAFMAVGVHIAKKEKVAV